MRQMRLFRKTASLLPMVALAAVALAAIGCGRAEPLANNRGNEAFAEQDYDGALREYEAALAENSDRPELFYNSANAHYRNEEYQEAQADIQQALLNADETLAQSSMFNQGNNYFQVRDLGNAIEAYKEALRLDPDDLDAKHNLELALQQLERQEEEEQTPEQEGQEPGPGDQEQEGDQGDQQGGDPQDGDQREPGDQPSSDEGEQPGGDEEEQDTGQPGPSDQQELDELQARRLLDSVGDNTETLQGHLQRTFVSPGTPPERDW